MVLVAINKTAAPLAASIAVATPGGRAIESAQRYRLTSAGAEPLAAGALAPLDASHLQATLPAYSVTTIALALPEPEAAGAALAACAALGLLAGQRRSVPRAVPTQRTQRSIRSSMRRWRGL
jgi:hypothetical protein